MRFSLKLYRLLLRLYPAGFRESYSAPLERQFRDEYVEAVGTSGVGRFWLQTLRDFVVSMPAQFSREIRQDVRHALRTWRRRPLPILFAIATLAIAIGANTGVFSVLNALLLRSLPFHEPDRVAALSHIGRGTPAAFHGWRQPSTYLEDAARYNTQEVNLDGSRASVRVRLTETSWNFFGLLGSQPLLGRAFTAEEDTPGHEAVVVIGYGLWQQFYGGDPRLLGSTLRVNGTALTIVGVARPGFDYPQKTALWSPSTFNWQLVPKTDVTFFNIIGRLKPELSWAQARSAFEAEAYTRNPQSRNNAPVNRPAMTPIQEQLAGRVKDASLILMAGVALLLLMACASVANLLLGRTAARSNELVIRMTLGASRARLTQQLLTESLLLSAAAAVFGLLIAAWTAGVATSTQPAQLAGQAYTIIDWRVLVFTAVLSIITGIVFGVGPAICMVRPGGGTLGRTATPTVNAGRARSALIAVQIALSIVLFTGSIALGRAFVTLMRTDNGFDVDHIATMNVSLAGTVHQNNAEAYFVDAFRRAREVPGVVSVSGTQFLPFDAIGFMGGHYTLDHTGTPASAIHVPIAPGYFQAMGGRILFGRDFTDHDRSSDRLAIVNEVFARGFGDPSTAIGRSVTAERDQPRKIVGVVQGMRYGPSDKHTAQVFSLRRSPQALTLVARVSGNARDPIAAIRDAVQSVDPKVPVFNVKTMQQRIDEALVRPKLYTTAVVFFGGLALLLVVIGVYGVVSYAVVQRTREMGIRLALGITPSRLRATLLWHSFVTVALGVVPGVWAAIAGAHYLESLVAGAESGIVTTSAVATLIAMGIAGAAIWSATRGVAHLDVMDVLRAENAE